MPVINMGDEGKRKVEIKMPPKKAASKSGAGMDKRISRDSKTIKKYSAAIVAVLVTSYFAYNYMMNNAGKSLTVNQDRISIASVKSDTFEDFIPVRGNVKPAKTLFLDAIDGGRVEKILVEDGTSWKAGDLIVELSNATLQLSVLGNEARVAEQLNNMRSIELSLQQNSLK